MAEEQRKKTPAPPKGYNKLKWYGPGLLWLVASVGSGSVLFTPRIGARYGYELLWLALIVFYFMWVMIREVGRYTVVTGKTIFEGYRDISGSGNWSIWFILVPTIAAAVTTVGGIAALAGSALMLAFPGEQAIYATALILISIVLVVSGQYPVVEKTASIMAALLILIVVTASIIVFPDLSAISHELLPGFPDDMDMEFVIPWVGFILAGSTGIMWFSYWVVAREYGGAMSNEKDVHNLNRDKMNSDNDLNETINEVQYKLKKWLKILSATAAIGVIGGGIVIVSFLTLGAELLRPEGIIPEGIDVAEDLTRLLSEIWGDAGFWILLVGIIIPLWGTILSNQDGYGRMFSDGTLILAMPFLKKNNMIEKDENGHNQPAKNLHGTKKKLVSWLLNKSLLSAFFSITLAAVLPLVAFFIVRNPVDILGVAGTIAAVHTPIVVFLTLYLNHKRLPKEFRPGKLITFSMILSGLFYGAFGVYYFTTL
jgi:Mn2+/Fe2+ NRAMP family transporter